MKPFEKKYPKKSKENICLGTDCSSQTDSCDILNIQTFHFTSNLQSVHKLGNVQTLRRNYFIFFAHKKRSNHLNFVDSATCCRENSNIKKYQISLSIVKHREEKAAKREEK